MVNKCKECGKCCLDTEMPISKQEILEIVDNYPERLNKKDFTLKVNRNHFQLKNIDGHCFFFNIKNRLCSIYKFRPQGCRFYPIIYDNEKNNCIYDDYCPRTNLFLLDKKELKNQCSKLKKFLMMKLKII